MSVTVIRFPRTRVRWQPRGFLKPIIDKSKRLQVSRALEAQPLARTLRQLGERKAVGNER